MYVCLRWRGMREFVPAAQGATYYTVAAARTVVSAPTAGPEKELRLFTTATRRSGARVPLALPKPGREVHITCPDRSCNRCAKHEIRMSSKKHGERTGKEVVERRGGDLVFALAFALFSGTAATDG